MRADRAALVAVVAACAALYAWPITWGLPSAHGWAPDEITPAAVVEGVEARFSGGWHAKYPPLHYAIVAVAGAPWLDDPVGPPRDRALFLAARTVSLAMACGIVACVYLSGRELYGPAPAVFAAAVAGFSAPLAYYAKVANVDAPYLFWFSLALLAFLRALRARRRRDFVLLAACAAAAVATKDQAYAMFLLMPVPLLLALRRARAGEPAWRSLLDRRFVLAAAVFAALFLLLTNAWLNPSGFAAHVRLITGPASRDFRMFDATPSGFFALAAATLRALVFTLGAPAFLCAAAGLVLALRRPRDNARLLATLASAAGYALGFLAVVLYVYDRFVLPLAIVGALFAGHALAAALATDGGARRRLAIAAAVLAASWSGLRTLSVDVLMARDSRYAVEKWLRAHAAPPVRVAAVGPLEYLPRMDGLDWRRVGPTVARLRAVQPDVVVLNADFARRADPAGADAVLYEALRSGGAGYRLVHAEPATPALPFLDTDAFRGDDPLRVHSNLDKIGPPLLVYARAATDPR